MKVVYILKRINIQNRNKEKEKEKNIGNLKDVNKEQLKQKIKEDKKRIFDMEINILNNKYSQMLKNKTKK